MVFELEQATYLAGFLGARMSQTGKLGLVGGIDLPSIRSTFVAFRAGALAARPDIAVREVFIGNFDDTAAAREAALALLEEGADVLLHQANDAGRGVFRAVSDRAAAGARVYAFGTNRDQNGMAPDVVLASATLDIPAAFVEVARRVRDGALHGRAAAPRHARRHRRPGRESRRCASGSRRRCTRSSRTSSGASAPASSRCRGATSERGAARAARPGCAPARDLESRSSPARPCSTASRSRSRRARCWRCSARTAPASRR